MISDKINKNNSLWTAGLCKILLVTSFMNAGLRSSPESAVTVFRVLAMLTIPFLLIRYFRLFVKELLLVGGILVLSLIQYFLFSITSFELIASSFVHLIFISSVYICVKILAHLDKESFPAQFYHFLDRFTEFTIVLILIEYIFSVSLFPATLSRDYPSVFCWNENELCSALFLMLPLYQAYWQKTGNMFVAAKIFLLIYFIYAFDCRVLMLSTILMYVLLPLAMNKHIRKCYKLALVLAAFLLVGGVVMFFHIDFNIPTADVESPFSSVVREPIISILKLERFYHGGSVFDRADAIVIGMQKLFETGGMGIGLGGCLIILNGELIAAQTMHNIFVQSMVELGIGFFIVYMVYLFKLYCRHSELSWFKLCFFLIVPLSSATSSGGIMSNYMFWCIVYYVFILESEPWNHDVRKIKET